MLYYYTIFSCNRRTTTKHDLQAASLRSYIIQYMVSSNNIQAARVFGNNLFE